MSPTPLTHCPLWTSQCFMLSSCILPDIKEFCYSYTAQLDSNLTLGFLQLLISAHHSLFISDLSVCMLRLVYARDSGLTQRVDSPDISSLRDDSHRFLRFVCVSYINTSSIDTYVYISPMLHVWNIYHHLP